METRYIQHRGRRISCLEFVLDWLRENLPMYLVGVLPSDLCSPTSMGAPVRRPREYIILADRYEYKQFSSSDEFLEQATALLSEVFRVARARNPASSFLDGLSPGPAAALSAFCPCACTLLHSCVLHPCGCGGRQLCACRWRGMHETAWRRTGAVPGSQPYFEHMWLTWGIDAGCGLTNHRQRDLLNLAFTQRGVAVCFPHGVLDLSQGVSREQFRSDGDLPTITTSSELYSLRLGRKFEPRELFLLMGFPATYDFEGVDRSSLIRLVGNTMHVGIVGSVIGVLLSLRSKTNSTVNMWGPRLRHLPRVRPPQCRNTAPGPGECVPLLGCSSGWQIQRKTYPPVPGARAPGACNLPATWAPNVGILPPGRGTVFLHCRGIVPGVVVEVEVPTHWMPIAGRRTPRCSGLWMFVGQP
jgi:hypothetical protein